MESNPYNVRATLMVRRTVLLSRRNGELQRLKTEFEQMYGNKCSVQSNESPPADDEICPMAKRRRMHNLKKKFRAAMWEFTRLHLRDHINYDT